MGYHDINSFTHSTMMNLVSETVEITVKRLESEKKYFLKKETEDRIKKEKFEEEKILEQMSLKAKDERDENSAIGELKTISERKAVSGDGNVIGELQKVFNRYGEERIN